MLGKVEEEARQKDKQLAEAVATARKYELVRKPRNFDILKCLFGCSTAPTLPHVYQWDW